MEEGKRKLQLLPDTYAVCRLEKNAPAPDWGTGGLFSSITRTEEELSVVCPDAHVPDGVKRQGGWRVLKVEGPLDFSLTGVLASLTAPLARKGISVFALSTYDTDYLLVKKEQLEKAIQALRGEGYEVEEGCRVQGEK
ncbi:MAG: ACT domain-containing protein [Deltaproteobacteria bacterium]|nr:ACT domain-containing protein [Deltaproteobacteria bacterium]